MTRSFEREKSKSQYEPEGTPDGSYWKSWLKRIVRFILIILVIIIVLAVVAVISLWVKRIPEKKAKAPSYPIARSKITPSIPLIDFKFRAYRNDTKKGQPTDGDTLVVYFCNFLFCVDCGRGSHCTFEDVPLVYFCTHPHYDHYRFPPGSTIYVDLKNFKSKNIKYFKKNSITLKDLSELNNEIKKNGEAIPFVILKDRSEEKDLKLEFDRIVGTSNVGIVAFVTARTERDQNSSSTSFYFFDRTDRATPRILELKGDAEVPMFLCRRQILLKFLALPEDYRVKTVDNHHGSFSKNTLDGCGDADKYARYYASDIVVTKHISPWRNESIFNGGRYEKYIANSSKVYVTMTSAEFLLESNKRKKKKSGFDQFAIDNVIFLGRNEKYVEIVM